MILSKAPAPNEVPRISPRVGISRLGAAGTTTSDLNRLVCFPYAGGNGLAYATWEKPLADKGVSLYAVELPGRLGRISQEPYDDVARMVGDIADQLEGWSTGVRYDLLGHSFGALIAYEVSRELQRRGGKTPLRLIISGFAAPSIVQSRKPMADLSDLELLDHIFSMAGTPISARTSDELTAMLVNTFRADVRMLEKHEHEETTPLRIPILVLVGNSDFGANLAGMRAWRELTARSIHISVFPGGHFFPWQGRGFLENLCGEVGSDFNLRGNVGLK